MKINMKIILGMLIFLPYSALAVNVEEYAQEVNKIRHKLETDEVSIDTSKLPRRSKNRNIRSLLRDVYEDLGNHFSHLYYEAGKKEQEILDNMAKYYSLAVKNGNSEVREFLQQSL